LTIIPFRIENVAPSKELEYFLCAPQWLDAVGKPFQQQLPSLVATVSQQLRKLRTSELTRKGLPLPPPPVPGKPVQAEKTGARGILPWVLAGGLAAILAVVGVAFAIATLTSGHAPVIAESPDAPPEHQPTTRPASSSDQSSSTVQELANRGIQRMRRGDFAGATEDFTAAIRLAPRSAQLYVFRAQSYGQRKDYEASITDWTQFIELEPESHQGYSARGQEYLRKNDYERALADFRKVIQLEPDSWLGYELMGDASRKKGDHKRTIEYYLEDLQHKPPDPAAVYFYMSEAAAQMGDAAQAEAYRNNAKSLDANVAQRLSAK
jgi:tetratricopeptide (TPR) repeat protein